MRKSRTKNYYVSFGLIEIGERQHLDYHDPKSKLRLSI